MQRPTCPPMCRYTHYLCACNHCMQGYAVRCGIAAARGQYILFADADGATPVAEVEKLEAELKRSLSPDAGV